MAATVWAAVEQGNAAEPFRTVGRGTVRQGPAESGGKLKWMPHRPTMPAPTQYQTAKRPARLVQHSTASPFNDPFGDASDSPKASNTGEGSGFVPLIPPGDQDADTADPAYPDEEPQGTAGRADTPLRSDRALTLAEELGTHAQDLDYACPSLDELKPIGKITYRTAPQAGEVPRDCTLGEREFQPRQWAQTTFLWKASALCHKPLYFEDVHLERYGHSWGPLLQPVLSGAHFFGSVLALPYSAGMYPPHECMYTLGYYRPGSCAPYMLDPIPLSVRGAAVAGAVWTGGVYAIP